MNKFKEEDMYKHIEKYFKNQGYRVDGEVADCDIVCIKDEELIVIEMKKNLSTKLLYQGLRRQKVTDKVYIAIPKPKKYTLTKRNEILSITKRLGLGVILINMSNKSKERCEIIVEPKKMSIVISKNRKKVLDEIKGRSVNINKGGITNKKINTAFREKCVKIGCILELIGESSPKDLVKYYECDEKTRHILYTNVYGWFTNVSKGVYKLNDFGLEKLHSEEFKIVYKHYKKEVNKLYIKINKEV